MRRILTAATLFVIVGSWSAEARPPRHSPPGTMQVLATAYCDRGPTRSGVRARRGVVAADTRRWPLGTRLQLLAPGQSYAGIYTVLDTGSGIRGRDLDIFMPSCAHARRFGRRTVQVRILSTGQSRGDRQQH
ncbi:MAG TPA: 3D domain-containing protein [Vicinamibacterales bacterium]|nr:3D domain-containing protein [Vicinamibacterales bacterium]